MKQLSIAGGRHRNAPAILFLLLSLGLEMIGTQRSSAAPAAFSLTGSQTVERAYHTATLLPSGKVLVAGGSGPNFFQLGSAELYDPATESWSPTGSLAAARRWHTATLLASGKVLVVGGEGAGNPSGPPLASAELYDPATGSWSTTGSLATERVYHTATLLPSGKVLVAGGDRFGTIGTAELYDPATGSWSTTGSLAAQREYHTATLLSSGKVLVAGGEDGATPLISAELYDSATGSWSFTGSFLIGQQRNTATLLPSGKVLVAGDGYFGNAGGQIYDPATGSWSVTGRLSIPRGGNTATLLPSGKVLVAGGYNFPDGTLASAELYDPASGSWSFTGSLVIKRWGSTETLLPSGKVLVTGGQGVFSQGLASAEIYDPTAALLNISARLRVLTGDNVLIGGFIITGIAPKRVIIRGLGPSLPLGGELDDPILELHKPDGSVITNDNWKATQRAEIEGTGLPPANDLESAIVTTLAPGAYTAILRGTGGTTGLGLVEIYDLAQNVNSKLANISSRSFVDTGDNAMIGGFTVGPASAFNVRVLVRAMGPSLPLGSTLQDPTLELHNGSGTLLAFNNDWKDTQQAQIEATGLQPSDNRESAILAAFAPGTYTAIVRGRNNTAGVGLVEVYNLP